MKLKKAWLILKQRMHLFRCLRVKKPIDERILEIQKIIEKAIGDLKSDDFDCRRKAILILEEHGKKGMNVIEAIPVLEELVYSKDRTISYCAALALGRVSINKISRGKVLEALFKAAENEDIEVKLNAIIGLKEGNITGRDIVQAVPTLAKSLKHDTPQIRQYAKEILLEAAEDQNSRKETIEAVAKSFESDEHIEYLSFLNKAARDGVNIVEAVPTLCRVLGNDYQRFVNFAAHCLEEAAKHECDLSKGIPIISGLLSQGKSKLKKTLILILAQAVKNENARKKAVEEISKTLRDDDAETRASAAKALKEAGQNNFEITSAVPDLINALKDEDSLVRLECVAALKSSKDINLETYIPQFIKLLQNKNSIKDAITFLLELSLTIDQAKQILSLTKKPIERKTLTDFAQLLDKCWDILEELREAA